jgi:streptomycin 6-kinase
LSDLDALLRRWGVHDPRLIADTVTSRVYRVRLDAGGTAIVKDLKPIADAETRGAAYLRWQDGRGCVRLLASDGDRLLLEDAGDRPLRDLLDRHGDAAATAVMAEVVSALHRSTTTLPDGLLPLEEHLASLFAAAEADRDLPYSQFVAAAELARRLLDAGHTPRPLHADLHHDNVFEATRGWLAIDPKGLLGDPAYDVANVFYNPLDRGDLRLDPARISDMAHTFAGVLERQPVEVLGWAMVDITLSAAWHTEDGRPDQVASDLRIVEAIRSVSGE